MRKRWFLLAGVGVIALGSSAEAVIPVLDGANLAEEIRSIEQQVVSYSLAVKSYLAQYWQMVTQYGQYISQLQQAYNEAQILLNFVHAPTYGQAAGLMNQAGLSNSLPFSPYAAINLVSGRYGFTGLTGIFNSLSGFAGASYNSAHIYTPDDGSWTSAQLMDQANTIAAGQGAALAAYGDYRTHQAVLPALRQNAATADTTKDALDTANALLVESVWTQNQNGQAQALATMTMLEQQSRVQRDNERLDCELEMVRTGGGACPKGDAGAVAVPGGVPAPTQQLPANTGNPMLALDAPVPTPPQQPPAPPAFEQPAPPVNQQQH